MLSSDSQNLSTTPMLLALGVTAETRPACEKLCYLSSDSQNLSTTASMLLWTDLKKKLNINHVAGLGVTFETHPAREKQLLCYLSSDSQNLSTTTVAS